MADSLSNEFAMRAEGSDTIADADVRADAANDSLYNSQPKNAEVVQMPVAQAEQPSEGNKTSMTAEQAKAVEQRNQITSKAANTGAALGAGDKGGEARMKSVQEAATKTATDVAKLDKKIAGTDQPKEASPMGNSFAKAAMGQVAAGAAVVATAAVAGPTAAAAVAVASTSYDVVKAFSGQSQDSSSFKVTNSKGEQVGYAASAPAQPATNAAPVSTAFMNRMSNIPGERKIDAGDVELAGASLRGIEKLPKFENTYAAAALTGQYRNGLEALKSSGEKPSADKDNALDLTPPLLKPNPGVFAPKLPTAVV